MNSTIKTKNILNHKRTTVVTVLYKEIRKAILEGRLPSKTRLSENQIAKEFGISRTPSREALLMLRGDGLVSPLLSGGFVVAQIDRKKDIYEIYDLRISLEGYAAFCAAERATNFDIENIRNLCNDLEKQLQQQPRDQLIALHKEFEKAIISAAHNERLSDATSKLSSYYYMSFVWLNYTNEQMYLAGKRQFELVESISNKNGIKAEALRREALIQGREIALEIVSKGIVPIDVEEL